jgi:hypothetical protein
MPGLYDQEQMPNEIKQMIFIDAHLALCSEPFRKWQSANVNKNH